MHEYFQELIKNIEEMDMKPYNQMVEAIKETIINRGTIYLCGNGGSSATAAHWANDFNKLLCDSIPCNVHACPLTDSCLLTTIGNDYSYDRIFSYPLSKWLKDGDLLILFSGSGKSPNIINAAELSKSRGIKTIGITGNNPSGILKDKVHIAVCVPTPNMQRIEDMHLILGHMLCYDISHILNPVGV